jgi:hypothetical protein
MLAFGVGDEQAIHHGVVDGLEFVVGLPKGFLGALVLRDVNPVNPQTAFLGPATHRQLIRAPFELDFHDGHPAFPGGRLPRHHGARGQPGMGEALLPQIGKQSRRGGIHVADLTVRPDLDDRVLIRHGRNEIPRAFACGHRIAAGGRLLAGGFAWLMFADHDKSFYRVEASPIGGNLLARGAFFSWTPALSRGEHPRWGSDFSSDFIAACPHVVDEVCKPWLRVPLLARRL